MIYECVDDFSVDVVDGDGFTEEQDGFWVKKGSMWKIDNDAVNVTGADVHLEELTGMNWLELSEERLKSCFRAMK